MKRVRESVLGRFVGESALLWAANMGGVLVSVIATIFVTRELGPEGRGVYTWLLTLAGIGSHFALFGMDNANRRLAGSEPETIPALLRLNIGLILAMGAVVALVLAVIADRMELTGVTWPVIAMALATVPLGAMMMAVAPVLVADNKVKFAALGAFLPKVLLALLFGAIVLASAVQVDLVLAVNLLAAVAGTLLPLWWLRKHLRAPGHLALKPYVATVWRTCSAAYIAGLAYYLMQKVDVLMIGYYMGEAPTGYYGVASNIADLMLMPIAVIAGMLGSRIAAAHKQGGGADGLTRQVVALAMGLAVTGCAFTWVIAPWLINLLFGAAFAPAAEVLRLLCFAVVGLCFFMLMHNILIATGRARYLAVPAVVGVVVNVALNVWLIPAYGLWGACVASIVAYPLAGLVGLLIIKRG